MDDSALAPALTGALAQEIAGDTSEIIGYNVLITDRDGIVIGSGDRSRVGSFHEASVDVVRTVRAATHDAAQARALRGVRPGITLPIVLNETALGTVGITGSPAQVRRFGLVVRRQTEILLRESVVLRSRLLRERALEDLVRDVAYFDADVVDPELIAYRAAELGYDLGVPRVAVVVDLLAPPGDREPADSGAAGNGRPTARLALLQTLRATFTPARDVVAAMPSDRFVALHRVAQADADRSLEAVRALCRKAVGEISRRHGVAAAVGIGDAAATVVGLHDSYQDASAAVRLGTRVHPVPDVTTIDDVRVHQLLTSVGHRPRARLVEALTSDLRTEPDWPTIRRTVIVWCESGFNLVQAAAALHIHRNTLVYRLGKIARVTGRPVRDHRATLALYVACLTDQLHDGEG